MKICKPHSFILFQHGLYGVRAGSSETESTVITDEFIADMKLLIKKYQGSYNPSGGLEDDSLAKAIAEAHAMAFLKFPEREVQILTKDLEIAREDINLAKEE